MQYTDFSPHLANFPVIKENSFDLKKTRRLLFKTPRDLIKNPRDIFGNCF